MSRRHRRPLEATQLPSAAAVRRRRSPTNPCSSSTSSGGRVALITLNRPHADNAITTELAAQPDRDPRDDRGPHVRARRRPRRGRGPSLLDRRRPAAAQGHDDRKTGCVSGRSSTASSTRCASCAGRSSPPCTAWPTAAAARSPSAPTSSSRSEDAVFGQPEAMVGLARWRRCAGLPPARPPPGQGHADADDRRADHRAGGVPAGDGQRGAPAGRADAGGAADRGEDREPTHRQRSRPSSGPSAWATGSRSSRRSRS